MGVPDLLAPVVLFSATSKGWLVRVYT